MDVNVPHSWTTSGAGAAAGWLAIEMAASKTRAEASRNFMGPPGEAADRSTPDQGAMYAVLTMV